MTIFHNNITVFTIEIIVHFIQMLDLEGDRAVDLNYNLNRISDIQDRHDKRRAV